MIYKPTFRDVMEQNQDLLIRATQELKSMLVYGLTVSIDPVDTESKLTIVTKALSDIEVTFDGKHEGSFSDLSNPVHLVVSAQTSSVEIRGYDGDTLVARRIVNHV